MSAPERDRLAEIKQRAKKATPGPWAEPYYDDTPGDQGWWIHNGQAGLKEGALAVTFSLNPNQESDGQFIAHGRADIDWLISEVERLRASQQRLINTVEGLIINHSDPGTEALAAVWDARHSGPHAESGGA